ncbi:uncharacterized protein SOCE26_031180 [Sorangium cellulosum]|uniref:Bulb-type lectin domain-containing protein n=1 Tax=Sorangium cellulosum TaxID=56 RepID=A0A2L0EQX8_SORCE|nr:hypothetical protein [Sorangium cellulosum]AUX41696.1 uncharacterized protein SOCE26_031180 [Sorangium cellulosum]
MNDILTLLRRALLPAASLAVVLTQAPDVSAQPVKPIWASNTQQSDEHCDPQTKVLGGQWMNRGTFIDSANGTYRLSMQDDGNLVLYRKGPNPQPLWATGTDGVAIRRVIMQTDGNLVLYDYADKPRWASNTHGNPGSFLVLQCDGNVVIYAPT